MFFFCHTLFVGDGKKLASVGLDDDHCIVVWDWKKGEKLASTRGHKDKIFLLMWNSNAADQMVTVGVKQDTNRYLYLFSIPTQSERVVYPHYNTHLHLIWSIL